MAKYPYYVPGKKVYKSWIRALLGYKKTRIITPASIPALIDSGADVCFCSKDIGIWLKVPLEKKPTFTFTTANRTTFSAVKETITLYACEKKYQCPFYFSDLLPHETPVILGQHGFFDHFKITFDLQNKKIEIT